MFVITHYIPRNKLQKISRLYNAYGKLYLLGFRTYLLSHILFRASAIHLFLEKIQFEGSTTVIFTLMILFVGIF